ncbi:MAG: hypothetical protein JXA25_13490 [Anaerolineales bacterium]|nr:hypothetical protein [Anaerolineales bacterium]
MSFDFSSVNWVEADQNPYGLRMLDCRSVTSNLVSSSQDQAVVDQFLLLRSQQAERLTGQAPEDSVTLPCSLQYPSMDKLPNGLNYRAEVLEDKWDILHTGEYLYFLRSWTGHLVFRAHLLPAEDSLQVDWIQVEANMLTEETSYSICQVDFLIKSHLYRREVPHPVPVELPDELSDVVLFSFSQYGRWAFYASYEYTAAVRLL